MNPARASLLILVLACGLAGCRHKEPPPPAPEVTAPPLPPSSMTHEQSLPPVPQPGPPKAGPPASDQAAAEETPAPAPKRPHRVKKHTPVVDGSTTASGTPSTAPATAPAAAPPTTAAQAGPPAPEPTLGQLSAGSGADSHERAAMTEEIHAQEVRLGAIKHPLNSDSEAITLQVKAFLTKARQAAMENDLDGARTLTMKAKVLLDELSNS